MYNFINIVMSASCSQGSFHQDPKGRGSKHMYIHTHAQSCKYTYRVGDEVRSRKAGSLNLAINLTSLSSRPTGVLIALL